MEIEYSPRFLRQYRKLPTTLQDIVDVRVEFLRADPFDICLRTHKLQGRLKGYHACELTASARMIILLFLPDRIRLMAVGEHDIYEKEL